MSAGMRITSPLNEATERLIPTYAIEFTTTDQPTRAGAIHPAWTALTETRPRCESRPWRPCTVPDQGGGTPMRTAWKLTLACVIAVLAASVVSPAAAGPRAGWTLVQSMSLPRYDDGAALLPDGRVLVAGGETAHSTSWLNSAEIYDPASATWSAAASMHDPRGGFMMATLPDGRILVAGGVGTTA